MIERFRNKHPPNDYAADTRTREAAQKLSPRTKRRYVWPGLYFVREVVGLSLAICSREPRSEKGADQTV